MLYKITYRPEAEQAPEFIEADEVTVEGESHIVLRKTVLVIGQPRLVPVRRVPAIHVAEIAEDHTIK